MDTEFRLTAKQEELLDLISGDATRILAVGGSRSGKTFGLCHALNTRAITTPGSRHGVFRSTLKACRETLFDLTFPAVMDAAYPGYRAQCKVSLSDHTITYPNGSYVIFGGLDDGARLEQILGHEFTTIYLNEVSQIKSFDVFEMMKSRLSQRCVKLTGEIAAPKFFFDCNPNSTKDWPYRAFVEKVHPTSKVPMSRPEKWAWIQMNPADNIENLHEDYLADMHDSGEAYKRRMLRGEWQTEVDGALFLEEWIDNGRIARVEGDLSRIVVAVDPSTSNNAGSDETGVIVAGIDADGHGYVLADYSVKGTPETWAKAAAAAYQDWSADLVVYEANQGGLMVETTLRSAGVSLPMKAVHASRGKVIRAEPISLLYEKGKISHVGEFKDLEAQLVSFTHDYNRTKQGSPDRLDALVWALTELMTVKQHKPATTTVTSASGFWR